MKCGQWKKRKLEDGGRGTQYLSKAQLSTLERHRYNFYSVSNLNDILNNQHIEVF